jgi:hypothetical protein
LGLAVVYFLDKPKAYKIKKKKQIGSHGSSIHLANMRPQVQSLTNKNKEGREEGRKESKSKI